MWNTNSFTEIRPKASFQADRVSAVEMAGFERTTPTLRT